MEHRGPIRFGEDFELDSQSYKLRRAGHVLKLERIPMEILLLLVEQRPKIVTREQIAEKIWGKNVFLDTNNSINGAVRKIRQVLRDDSEQPRFIQTITGTGYRFIAPVAEQEIDAEVSEARRETGLPEAPAAVLSQPETVPAIVAAPFPTWAFVASVAALLAFLGGAWLWRRPAPRTPTSGARSMLAVLPFENLTGDAKQEYFSDGLTEEMITRVGNLDPAHLGVIARTSVMHYKKSAVPLDQIGRELGVQYVVEGSVRRDANHVRVTAQLIQTKDQSHIWARQYDRDLTGLLTLQDEITQEIADEIRLTLGKTRSVVPRPGPSPPGFEAYDLCLKGQYFFNKRTLDSLREAADDFQKAVVKDPKYARAYVGLADCFALMGGYLNLPQTEFGPKARSAAVQALQIDDSMAEAHAALALIVQNYDWDWQTAEKEFRRAIELNPNDATAHHWYAEHLMWRGRFDDALRESERARQLDPLSLIVAADNGAILYFSRHYDRAIEKWRSVLEMDPEFLRAHLIRAAYLEKGMFAEALADTERARPITPVPSYLSWLACIYGRAGRISESRHSLRELLEWNRGHSVDPMMIAWAYVGVGEKDQALAWLEKAYAQHSNELTSLKVHPGYDSLRGDTRFQDLLRRVGSRD